MPDSTTTEVPPDKPPPETSGGFEIRVDGEKVHTVDIDPRLVTQVSLRSAQGEAGIAGSPFSGEGHNWINLALVVQQPTSLPVVEDDARLAAHETAPEEVLTYNPVAEKAEEDVPLADDGSAADTSGEPETPTQQEAPAKATSKSKS